MALSSLIWQFSCKLKVYTSSKRDRKSWYKKVSFLSHRSQSRRSRLWNDISTACIEIFVNTLHPRKAKRMLYALCFTISLRTLCNSPEIKTLDTHCRSQNACTKMSRRSRSFFSELVNAATKRFYMMVNYPLSRGLGNITKVYLITCSQSTCAKLKKYEICPVGHGGIANMQCVRCIMYIKNIYFVHKFYLYRSITH